MGAGSQIRAGAAFVELKSKDSDFIRGMRRAQRQLQAFGDTVMQIGRSIAIGSGAFALLGAASIKAASDAEESLNRFGAVFKDQTEAAGAFADELAERVGRSAIEIKDSLASLQGFFVGLGYGAQEARALSQEMTALALDFASFNNLSDEEAISRFISALSGSSEVLDKFGINTKQAALQQELLALGINKAWSEVTEQEKALARYSIIARTMGEQGAIGDATKTAGSFANQMKRLRANISDAAKEIGRALIPFATKAITIINTLAKSVVGLIRENQGAVVAVASIVGIAGGAAAALIGIGIAAQVAAFAVGGLVTIIGVMGTAVGIAGGVLAALLSPIGLVVAALVGLGVVGVTMSKDLTNIAGVLLEVFKKLGRELFGVLGDIVNAITAGDLELAMEIASKGIELVWVSMIERLKNAWTDYKGWLKRVIGESLVGYGFTDTGLKLIADNAPKGPDPEGQEEIRRLTEELRMLREQKPESIFGTGSKFQSLLDQIQLTGVDGGGGIERSASGVFATNALRNLATPEDKAIETNTKLTYETLQQMLRLLRLGGGLVIT